MSGEAIIIALLVLALIAIEASLFWLALSHARRGARPRLTRWATRVGLAGTLAASIGGVLSAWSEATTYDYPWTLPGHPFGTYDQPTLLGMLEVAAWSSLFGVAAVVAAFRPRLGAGLLAVGSLWVFVGALLGSLLDETAPAAGVLQATLMIVFPALIVAALVWSLRVPAIRRS